MSLLEVQVNSLQASIHNLSERFEARLQRIENDFSRVQRIHCERVEDKFRSIENQMIEIHEELKSLDGYDDDRVEQLSELEGKLNNLSERFDKAVINTPIRMKLINERFDAIETTLGTLTPVKTLKSIDLTPVFNEWNVAHFNTDYELRIKNLSEQLQAQCSLNAGLTKMIEPLKAENEQLKQEKATLTREVARLSIYSNLFVSTDIYIPEHKYKKLEEDLKSETARANINYGMYKDQVETNIKLAIDKDALEKLKKWAALEDKYYCVECREVHQQ